MVLRETMKKKHGHLQFHYYGDEKYANVFSYGEYKKVGNIVHIKGMLELQSATPSISQFCLKDLPYNPIGYISKEIGEIYAGHVMIGSTRQRRLQVVQAILSDITESPSRFRWFT